MISMRDFFYSMAFPTTMTIWTVENNSNILRSDDAGITWDRQKSPVRQNLLGIAAWDTERAVAVGNNGIVIVTRDGGKTWNEVSAPLSDIANKLLGVRIFNDHGFLWSVSSPNLEFSSMCNPSKFLVINSIISNRYTPWARASRFVFFL